MALSKLKDKGQITLPYSIRKEIHAQRGDMFDFKLQPDETVIMTKKQVIQDEQTGKQRRKDLSHWLENKVSVFKDAREVDNFIRKQRDLWT